MATHDYSNPLINESSKPNNSKTTKKIILFTISFIACFSLIAYIYFTSIQPAYPSSSISSLCEKSEYFPYCHALVTQVIDQHDNHTTSLSSRLRDLLRELLVGHVAEVVIAKKLVNLVINKYRFIRGALLDCLELMDLSHDQIADIIKEFPNVKHNDLNIWLSAVLDNHATCLLQLQDQNPETDEILDGLIFILKSLISKTKALLAVEVELFGSFHVLNNPQTLSYPSWVSKRDKKLLEASGSEIEADVVVAKDGSGNYTSVAAAVEAAPKKPPKGKDRYVIYVKAGVYEENVNIKNKKKLMITGDGMNATIITSDLNVTANVTTFNCATLASNGKGFILQDIGIYNTAGPDKGQAVALRVNADYSVINRCKFDAYQDTLYIHSYRQFYRECNITGTVDFIFGHAAAVLQNCTIMPRRPGPNQKNMVTAQGKQTRYSLEGFSLQFCNITPSEDLATVIDQFPTFLGRPWKEYATVMVMQSYLSDAIDPKGWSPWNDSDFALKTLNFSEYGNSGPGSNTSGRVDWPTYHHVTDPVDAMPFTVNALIQGNTWIGSSNVSFIPGL